MMCCCRICARTYTESLERMLNRTSQGCTRSQLPRYRFGGKGKLQHCFGSSNSSFPSWLAAVIYHVCIINNIARVLMTHGFTHTKDERDSGGKYPRKIHCARGSVLCFIFHPQQQKLACTTGVQLYRYSQPKGHLQSRY